METNIHQYDVYGGKCYRSFRLGVSIRHVNIIVQLPNFPTFLTNSNVLSLHVLELAEDMSSCLLF